MYKGLMLITQSLTRCVYFLMIFLFFVSLNCSQSFPIDSRSRHRDYDYNLNLVQSIPETNTFLNYAHSISNFNSTRRYKKTTQGGQVAVYRRSDESEDPPRRTFGARNRSFDRKRAMNAAAVARRNGVRHSRRRRKTSDRPNRLRSVLYERYDAKNRVTVINSRVMIEDEASGQRKEAAKPRGEIAAYADYGDDGRRSDVRDADTTDRTGRTEAYAKDTTDGDRQTDTGVSNALSNFINPNRDETFEPASISSPTADFFLNKRLARATNQSEKTKHRAHSFCPGFDLATRVYEAPTVYAGKVRSRSKNNNAVTFEVTAMYKNQSGFRPLVNNETIRLNFMQATNCTCRSTTGSENVSFCRPHPLKSAKTYLLFLNRVGAHNYTILGPPVSHSQKNIKIVERVLKPKAAKDATIISVEEYPKYPKLNEKINITCRVRGFPPPRITWLKNGTNSFLRTRRIKVLHRRRESTLVIPKFRADDEGHYVCKAKGVTGIIATKSVYIRNQKNSEHVPTPEGVDPQECDEGFCLNGGQCSFVNLIREKYCICAHGFQGDRCATKSVNVNSTYSPYSCDNQFLAQCY